MIACANLSQARSRLALAFLLAAALTALALVPRASAATTVDRIVALVNNDVITLSELQARLKNMTPILRGNVQPGPDLERQVLDYMVELELLHQEARRLGIVISDQEVNAAMESIKQENNLTDEQLKASLAQSGLTEAGFRSDVKEEILKNRVLGVNIMRKIVVTEQEVTAFLRGEGPRAAAGLTFTPPSPVTDSYVVKFIQLASPRAQATKVLEQAAKIKGEIDAGLPFAEAASRYSQGPERADGGATGLTVADLHPQLQNVARGLGPGEVSQPLDLGEVVLLMTVEPGQAEPALELATEPATPKKGAKEEFAPAEREAARRQLEQAKMRQKYETWISELKRKANIKISL
ncbi:MAG: SurA N-terminal domain-containing protein [Deltaproteobacteria bacterium]|jgi:peptidyl-prolyl cis-trans isomerase SurA|nr:SurA N-terminal domain-containing protein [Deltaproteobacteria bacterium]